VGLALSQIAPAKALVVPLGAVATLDIMALSATCANAQALKAA